MGRILLVDDEYDIKTIIEETLIGSGHELDYAPDGLVAQEKYEEFKPDLVILDVMLPGINGFELCRRWRRDSDVSILILSAKSDLVDKTIGFERGCDDYLTKPFSPVELSLRVEALLRRRRNVDKVGAKTFHHLRISNLEIDSRERTVIVNEKPVDLTPREFDLLLLLVRNPGQVFTKQQLFEQIWDEEALGDPSTVTVFMRKLREKIEDDPGKPVHLKTVWGVGYKFSKD